MIKNGYLFKLVHLTAPYWYWHLVTSKARTVAKRAVRILLECFLVRFAWLNERNFETNSRYVWFIEPHLFRFQFNTKAVHIPDAHTVRGIDAHPPAPAPTQTPTQQHGTRASHCGRQVQPGHLRLRSVLRTGASLNVAGSRLCAAAGGRAIPGEYTQLPC